MKFIFFIPAFVSATNLIDLQTVNLSQNEFNLEKQTSLLDNIIDIKGDTQGGTVINAGNDNSDPSISSSNELIKTFTDSKGNLTKEIYKDGKLIKKFVNGKEVSIGSVSLTTCNLVFALFASVSLINFA